MEELNLNNFTDKYKNLSEGDSALVEAILTLVKQLEVITRKL